MAYTYPNKGDTDWDVQLDSILSDLDTRATAAAADAGVLHKSGNESVTGVKTFTVTPVFSDQAAARTALGLGSAATHAATDFDLVNAADTVNTALVALKAAIKGLALKSGGVWPSRPSGYAMVEWRGASPGPSIGGSGAVAGLDEWIDTT